VTAATFGGSCSSSSFDSCIAVAVCIGSFVSVVCFGFEKVTTVVG
jgi:hypothetical protein